MINIFKLKKNDAKKKRKQSVVQLQMKLFMFSKKYWKGGKQFEYIIQ